jgi:hypothetical protein
MPDEQAEQPEVDVEERSVEETEQPIADVAVESTPDVADDVAQDVAESEVPDLANLLRNDDGIDRLLSDEQLGRTLKGRLEKEQKDAELRGRQAYEKELRQQAVSDDVLQDRLKSIALEAGWDAENEALKRVVSAFHKPADEYRAIELAKLHIAGASQGFTEDGKRALEIAVQQAGNDLVELNRVVDQLWQYHAQTAQESGRKSYEDDLDGMSAEELRTNPRLVSLFEKWQAAEDKAEAKAQQIRANRADGISTSGGSPAQAQGAPSSLTEFETKLASEGSLTEAEWQAYTRARATAGMR